MLPADWATCILMAKNLHGSCQMQWGVAEADLDNIYANRAAVLYEFPADVAYYACKRWGREHKLYPTEHELFTRCSEVASERRRVARAIAEAIRQYEHPAPLEAEPGPMTPERHAEIIAEFDGLVSELASKATEQKRAAAQLRAEQAKRWEEIRSGKRRALT
jgi:hypothetical protein